MALCEELLELDRGFWTGGEDYFRTHVDEECVLIFEEKQGVFPREEVAASAGDASWKAMEIEGAFVQQPTAEIAMLGYEASGTRDDGTPYRAMIGSGYVKRDSGWKLAFHEHSEVEMAVAESAV